MVVAGKTKPRKPEIGSFAWYLKKLREESGLSQSKLALHAGKDHSYISRLENGTRAPARSSVFEIARALGLKDGEDRFEKLLDLSGFRTLRGSVHFATPVIWELNNQYRIADKETQQEINAALKLLIEVMNCRKAEDT